MGTTTAGGPLEGEKGVVSPRLGPDRLEEEATAGGKRVRPTGRKNRAWFKYCKSLPTHLKRQQHGECGQGHEQEQEPGQKGGAGKDPAPEQDGGTSFRASDPSRDRGRRVGLPEAERCTVWLAQKKRLCSQRRAAPDCLFCLSHLQNPPPEDSKPAAASAAAGPSMSSCPSCRALVAAAKLEKHKGRCNVLRREAEQESQPYYLYHVNSGGAEAAAGGGEGGAQGPATTLPGTLAELAEHEFASRVLEKFEQHVPSLQEEVLEAKGCEALFEASRAGGKERQDKHGSLYKHLLQDSSIIAHAQRAGLLSPVPCEAGAGSQLDGEGNLLPNSGKVFVEFGAGKGMLSLATVHCVPGAQVALVDREEGGSRSKTDRTISSCGGTVTRLTIDIRHLHLAGAGWGAERPVVALSKHLCGYGRRVAVLRAPGCDAFARRSSLTSILHTPGLLPIYPCAVCSGMVRWARAGGRTEKQRVRHLEAVPARMFLACVSPPAATTWSPGATTWLKISSASSLGGARRTLSGSVRRAPGVCSACMCVCVCVCVCVHARARVTFVCVLTCRCRGPIRPNSPPSHLPAVRRAHSRCPILLFTHPPQPSF